MVQIKNNGKEEITISEIIDDSTSMKFNEIVVNDFPLGFKKITHRKYLFTGVPIYDEEKDDFQYIDVVMRKLMRKDKIMLQGLDMTNPDSIGRVVSLLVEKWGDKKGITSIELELDKYEEALEALNFCFAKILQPNFSLKPIS